MANGSQTVSAVITADAAPFKRAVISAGDSFGSFSSVVRAGALVAAAAIAGISAAIYTVGRDSIKAATEYEDVAAAVGQIFGEASQGIRDFAKEAPTLLGQSQNAFLGAVKQFGVFGQAAGLAEKDNAAFAKQLAILATDLRSFNGGTVEEAIAAIGSGLRGESEPLKRYGVFLDDAALKAEALAIGIYDGNGPLTAQQKILAANSTLLKQTSIQQGDFARTQDSMANSAEKLNAQLDDVRLTIGNALIPVLQPVVEDLAAMFDNMKDDPEFLQFVRDLADNFQNLTGKLQDALPKFANFVNDILPAMAAAIPVITEGLTLLGEQLGIVGEESETTSGGLQGLADFFTFVSEAIANLNGLIDAFNKGLDDANVNIFFIGSPLLGLEGNINAVTDALTILVDLWNLFWGIQESRPLMNPSTGEGVPGVNFTPPPRYADDRRRPMTYNISVNAIAPTAEVGRAVVDSLQAYQRIGGSLV